MEYSHAREAGGSGDEMKAFMASQGYSVHSLVLHPNYLAHDFIFIQNSLKEELERDLDEKERQFKAALKSLKDRRKK